MYPQFVSGSVQPHILVVEGSVVDAISGGAIHPAILPGSVTRCIRLAMNPRSLAEGSHWYSRRRHSSSVIGRPSRSVATAAQTPIERWKRTLGNRNRKPCLAAATSRFRRCTPHNTVSISATSEWRTMSPSPSCTTATRAIGSSRRAISASPERPSRRSL